jgi:hypothetical protein
MFDSFPVKQWENDAAGETPVSASALKDLERRLAKAGAPYVSSLPTEPEPGEECLLIADAAKGIVWHLVYTGLSTYPWTKIGGPALSAIKTGETITTTEVGWVATNMPSITLPADVAMVAAITWAPRLEALTENALSAGGMAPFQGATQLTQASSFAGSNIFDGGPGELTAWEVPLVGNVAVQLKYGNEVAGHKVKFIDPRLAVDPVRLG